MNLMVTITMMMIYTMVIVLKGILAPKNMKSKGQLQIIILRLRLK